MERNRRFSRDSVSTVSSSEGDVWEISNLKTFSRCISFFGYGLTDSLYEIRMTIKHIKENMFPANIDICSSPERDTTASYLRWLLLRKYLRSRCTDWCLFCDEPCVKNVLLLLEIFEDTIFQWERSVFTCAKDYSDDDLRVLIEQQHFVWATISIDRSLSELPALEFDARGASGSSLLDVDFQISPLDGSSLGLGDSPRTSQANRESPRVPQSDEAQGSNQLESISPRTDYFQTSANASDERYQGIYRAAHEIGIITGPYTAAILTAAALDGDVPFSPEALGQIAVANNVAVPRDTAAEAPLEDVATTNTATVAEDVTIGGEAIATNVVEAAAVPRDTAADTTLDDVAIATAKSAQDVIIGGEANTLPEQYIEPRAGPSGTSIARLPVIRESARSAVTGPVSRSTAGSCYGSTAAYYFGAGDMSSIEKSSEQGNPSPRPLSQSEEGSSIPAAAPFSPTATALFGPGAVPYFGPGVVADFGAALPRKEEPTGQAEQTLESTEASKEGSSTEAATQFGAGSEGNPARQSRKTPEPPNESEEGSTDTATAVADDSNYTDDEYERQAYEYVREFGICNINSTNFKNIIYYRIRELDEKLNRYVQFQDDIFDIYTGASVPFAGP